MKLAIFAALCAVPIATAALAERITIPRDDYYALPNHPPCACPDDHTRRGATCGRLSAFCRCNGYEPIGCYPGDNDPDERMNKQLHYCGYTCLYHRRRSEPN
jgi:hypothetical protein